MHLLMFLLLSFFFQRMSPLIALPKLWLCVRNSVALLEGRLRKQQEEGSINTR